MNQSTFRKFVLCSLLLTSLGASAGITKNGIYYTLWFNQSCRDGSTAMWYLNQWWCHTYQTKLTWVAPSTRENGQPLALTDIAGYEVYWGRSIDARTGTIPVSGNTISTVTFEAQTPATYYFVISAVDTNGRRSLVSKMVETKFGQ
jgi:hypothetical protein